MAPEESALAEVDEASRHAQAHRLLDGALAEAALPPGSAIAEYPLGTDSCDRGDRCAQRFEIWNDLITDATRLRGAPGGIGIWPWLVLAWVRNPPSELERFWSALSDWGELERVSPSEDARLPHLFARVRDPGKRFLIPAESEGETLTTVRGLIARLEAAAMVLGVAVTAQRVACTAAVEFNLQQLAKLLGDVHAESVDVWVVERLDDAAALGQIAGMPRLEAGFVGDYVARLFAFVKRNRLKDVLSISKIASSHRTSSSRARRFLVAKRAFRRALRSISLKFDAPELFAAAAERALDRGRLRAAVRLYLAEPVPAPSRRARRSLVRLARVSADAPPVLAFAWSLAMLSDVEHGRPRSAIASLRRSDRAYTDAVCQADADRAEALRMRVAVFDALFRKTSLSSLSVPGTDEARFRDNLVESSVRLLHAIRSTSNDHEKDLQSDLLARVVGIGPLLSCGTRKRVAEFVQAHADALFPKPLALVLKGMVLYATRRLPEAQEHFWQAAGLLDAGSEEMHEQLHLLLGLAAMELGQATAATAHFARLRESGPPSMLLTLGQARFGELTANLVGFLCAAILPDLYATQGSFRAARFEAERTLRHLPSAGPASDLEALMRSRALNVLVRVAETEERPAEAADLRARVREVISSALAGEASSPVHRGNLLAQMASSLARDNRLEDALAHCEQALAAIASLPDERAILELRLHFVLQRAGHQRALHRLDAAEVSLSDARSAFDAIRAEHAPEADLPPDQARLEADVAFGVALQHVARGNLESAILQLQRSIALHEDAGASAYLISDRVLHHEAREQSYQELGRLLIQQGREREALVLSDRRRGQLVVEFLQAEPVRRSEDVQLARARCERSAEALRAGLGLPQLLLPAASVPGGDGLAEVAMMALDRPGITPEERERVRGLRAEYDKDRELFDLAHLRRWRTGRDALDADHLRYGYEDISARALFAPGEDALALTYVYTAKGLVLLVTTPESDAPVVLPLADGSGQVVRRFVWGAAADDAAALHRISRLTSGVLAYPRAAVDRVSRCLLPPRLLELLRPGQRIYVSATHSTALVPFAMLQMRDEDGRTRHLVERHPITYVPSLKLLTLYRKLEPGRGRAVYVQGPKDGELEHARREVEEVARIHGGAVRGPFSGGNATLDRFDEYCERARIAHIATHGFFEASAPFESGLHMADGTLTLERLMQKHKRSLQVDLVVLSACESACSSMKSAGVELFGLPIGFFGAGCRAVMASGWRVDDASTRALMVDFHRGVREQMPTDVALQRAQCALIADARERLGAAAEHDLYPLHAYPEGRRPTHHPFFWSGFRLIGDPAPVVL